jgi:hypothetical protein
MPPALILATVAIRLAASFSTEGRVWGVNHLAFFSRGFAIGYLLVFTGLFALLAIPGANMGGAGRVGRPEGRFARLRARTPRLVAAAISALLLGLFAAFSSNTHVLGDGALRLKQMRELGLGDAFRTIVPEPVDYVLHYALDRFVVMPLGLSTLATFRALSYLAGLLFFWTAWAIAGRLRARGIGAGLTLAYLLCWGGSLMFFGYVEEYALAAAAMLLFFLLGLDFFDSRRGVAPLIATFLVCFFLHNFTIVLLPSLIYACLWRRKRGGGSRLLLLVPTLLLVAGWMIVVIVKRGAGTLLLPQAASDPGYFLWSRAHLADMLNELFLVSPAFLVLLWLQRGRGWRGDPVRTFVWLAGGSGLLLLFLADPQLGMARDWDLFSLPLLAFHVALLLGADWSRVGRITRSAILVLSISATSLWIVLNSVDAKSLVRCENVVGLEGKRARYGFAMLGDYYFVHERWVDAERMFQLSLRKQRHHDSYLGLAQVQAELGKEAEAVENLKRTLELDPTNPRALMLLGRYYYAKERWTEAREIFVRLLRTPEGRNDPNVIGMMQELDATIAREQEKGGVGGPLPPRRR